MKSTKKILALLLAALLCLGLFACKKDETPVEDSSDAVTVEDISFLDYAIIRPEKVSDVLLDRVSDVYMSLYELTGTDNTISSDWLADGTEPDAEAKEILIGHTNRPETRQVLESLSANEYAVAVIGNKVVITGITDSITPAAVKYFINTYLTGDADGKLPGDLFYKGSVDTALLVDKGEPIYTLVRSSTADDNMVDLMYRVSDAITNVSGVILPIKTDRLNTGETYDLEAYEILFGDTEYPQTQDIKPNVDPDAYKIDFIGNKIVIYAWNVQGIEKAVNAFADMLTYACYIDSEDRATVCVTKDSINGKNETAKFYIDVPYEASGTRYTSVYDCYEGAMELYWKGASESMLTDYRKSLEAMGYTLHQEMSNTSISSATYYKNRAEVHTYYLKNTKELRVITQDNALLPINAYEYTKVCDPAVTQLCLDYVNTPENSGGMGYLILLEDGTFVVIDGGDYSDYNAENLYNLMVAQKPMGVNEIVIKAWILTHGHTDHYGVLRKFMENYNDKVKVEYLLGNDASDYIYNNTDMGNRAFNFSSVNGKFGGCKYMKVHTGQQFFFPGVTMTMLYTHEDVFPQKPFVKYNSNVSLAFDAVIEDTRFLWLADMESEGAKTFKNMYFGDMKCDVLQMAHHGVKGATTDIYQLCNPSIAFWPAGDRIVNSNEWWNLDQNRYIRESVDQLIISKDGNYTIWFGEQVEIGGFGGLEEDNTPHTKFY